MDLDGKLLIARPGMGDPRFEKSVILICAHTPEGARKQALAGAGRVTVCRGFSKPGQRAPALGETRLFASSGVTFRFGARKASLRRGRTSVAGSISRDIGPAIPL